MEKNDKKVYILCFAVFAIVAIVAVVHYWPADQWPDTGLATLIDQPEFAKSIEIVENTEDTFQVRIKGLNMHANYESYVKACSSKFSYALDIRDYHSYAPKLQPFYSMAEMYDHITDYGDMIMLSTYDQSAFVINDNYYRAYDEKGNQLTISFDTNLFITVQSARGVAEFLARYAPKIP